MIDIFRCIHRQLQFSALASNGREEVVFTWIIGMGKYGLYVIARFCQRFQTRAADIMVCKYNSFHHSSS
jgi:hypothetical protein